MKKIYNLILKSYNGDIVEVATSNESFSEEGIENWLVNTQTDYAVQEVRYHNV